jgi:hypothetical protein
MLIKEEKILMMAKQSDEPSDIIKAVTQVVNNCIETPNIDVEKLTYVDIEYLFMKLRAISISNIVELSYEDPEDNKQYDFKVDLDEVEVKFPEDSDPNIELSKDLVMVLKYPDISVYTNQTMNDLPEDERFNFILKNSIYKLFEGDQIHDIGNATESEYNEFIDSIGAKEYEKIQMFFTEMPRLHHELKYTNENGNEREIVLSGLNDFFTL